ncbi:MAG: class II fructose-bisphosphate aldolase, partial [Pseudomonadota bacterium]
RIAQIDAATEIPLVIHGGSGVPQAQRQHLARHSSICKFNIGTELRMVFGAALRQAVAADPDRFDRVQILSEVEAPLTDATRKVLRGLKPG